MVTALRHITINGNQYRWHRSYDPPSLGYDLVLLEDSAPTDSPELNQLTDLMNGKWAVFAVGDTDRTLGVYEVMTFELESDRMLYKLTFCKGATA